MITLTKAEIKQMMQEIFVHRYGKKEELIPILQETQQKFRHLPLEAMTEISRFLRVPESTIYGVSTFYSQFKLKPMGKKIVKVCRGTACHVRGGAKVLAETEKVLGIKAGETSEDLEWTIETIACFGSCALAPVLVVDDEVHGRMATSKVKEILDAGK